ncbi:LysR substrate-binding domain-containing protein [Caballeronia sp. GaOx3]|uniref:LysR substrate-binding domain-containing protein n=1 Tax=Caballeronia sp. GaOx3 TaxID=2921740 RepID=UPI00254006A5|nr:LysR substrate-binding domain-containing protein [Caballeronia sp. GaOx3]
MPRRWDRPGSCRSYAVAHSDAQGVDLAVRIGGPPDPPSSFGRRFLGREPLIFCVAPAYREKRHAADDRRPAGTWRHRVRTTRRHAVPWPYAVADGQVEQCVVRPRIVAGDAEAHLVFVRAGLGIAQLATWLVRDDLKGGYLVNILNEAATHGLPLSLLWSVARQVTPKVHVLGDILEAHLHIR